MSPPASDTAWPRAVLAAPLLRGLDARGQRELAASGRLLRLQDGEAIYAAGDRQAALFVVAEGSVELRGVRRGDDVPTVLRVVTAGESFGEEASIGASYRATATAGGAAVVAEIAVAMLRRALGRAGGGEVALRSERRLKRRAGAELLSTSAFTRDLPEADLELLLDAMRFVERERGQAIYRRGEPPTALWLVADGMVQLQTEDDDRLRVRAYLSRGDFFGDEELAARAPRRASAVASGASLLVAIDADVARTVGDRNPGLLGRLRRVADAQAEVQQAVIGEAAMSRTQHAFKDLYRLQVARSLLVIDLDQCVRCGHCAWSCEALHGVARLVRRGDTVVTRFGEGPAPSPLLLPNSCQHCENPACMPDCPTGAIGRDPRGEVYIRDALCTGCGACAKGCPWDNIQIVPRPLDAPRPGGAGRFDELAVKCDLCRGYEGPACVESCPTQAIVRINPADDLPDLARLLSPRAETKAPSPRRGHGPWVVAAGLLAAALGVFGATMHARHGWAPYRGLGWAAGVMTAVCFAALWAYALPKRLVRRRARPRRASLEPGLPSRTRSRLRPHLTVHVSLGLAASGLLLCHAGAGVSLSTAGGAALALYATSALGLWTALAYALLPRRLSRIERDAALPEDLGPARAELDDQLHAAVSGRSELVKTLFARVLVPYLRRPFGALGLVLSGRSLRQEREVLRARIDRMLEGRGGEKLLGLDELIRRVVELRALTAVRWLTALLRVGLPAHIVAAAIAAVLLLLHLGEVLLWR